MTTVLFDDNCMLCRTLAAWAAKRADASMTFVSWQEHYGSDAGAPSELRVLADDTERDGADAWAFLLAHYPDLSAVNWIAERLGIQTGVAQALHRAGGLSRRLCRGCGEKPW